MVELLLPAGNYKSMLMAVNHGADAVYLGLSRFNARAGAENFDTVNLIKAIKHCHLFGVRVYVALNISIKEDELKQAAEDIALIDMANADGIIITDIGLIPLINNIAPNLPIHISTQAGVNNLMSAEFFYKLGADRVVLARESIQEDIIDIRDNLKIDMEYFVHGALCVSFSGGCLMSSIVSGKSGNRGMCLQPCRLKYTLKMNNFEKEGYMLSTSDLCLLSRLSELEKMGITSFKIEGRLKRGEYTAQAAKSYRAVLDGKSTYNEELPMLKRAFNRGGYSEGYIFSNESDIMSTDVQGHIGEHIGKVIRTLSRGGYSYAIVSSSVELTKGDGLKILRDGIEIGGAEITSAERQSDGIFLIPVSKGAKAGDDIYLTTDSSINLELNEYERKLMVDIKLRAYCGKPLSLTISHNQDEITINSDYIVLKAEKSPLAIEDIISSLDKVKDTAFQIQSIEIEKDNDIFIPRVKLNEIRRAGIEAITEKIINSYKRNRVKNRIVLNNTAKYKKELNKRVIELNNINQLSDTIKGAFNAVVYNPDDYTIEAIENFLAAALPVKVYLMLPRLIRNQDKSLLGEITEVLIRHNAGIYASNYGHIELARKLGLKYIAGLELNIYNTHAMDMLNDADYILVSPELNREELKPLLDKGGLYYAFGHLPLMNLSHCPIKLAAKGTCISCDFSGELSYTDRLYTYQVRRKRLKGCTFTMYNHIPVNLIGRMKQGYNEYLSFSLFRESETKRLISQITAGEKLTIEKHTTGYLNR